MTQARRGATRFDMSAIVYSVDFETFFPPPASDTSYGTHAGPFKTLEEAERVRDDAAAVWKAAGRKVIWTVKKQDGGLPAEIVSSGGAG